MSGDETGYRRPPKHTRFKPGASGNPKGRPKRRPFAAGEIINAVFSAPASYRERGRTKTATRHEVTLKALTRRALNGDVGGAEMLLAIRLHAQRFGNAGIERIQIRDWLPDYPGQTGEQKTRDLLKDTEVDATGWWTNTTGSPKTGSS